MKKFTLIILALCFASTVAFADDAKLTVGADGFVYSTTYDTIAKNQNGDFSEMRINPLLTISKDGTDVVLKLRVDEEFGANFSDPYNGPYSGTQDTAVAHNRAYNVKAINAFLRTKVDALPGLTLTGGIQGYAYPLIFDDNAPLLTATYDFGMGKVTLAYLKLNEGLTTKGGDDSQMYILDATLKFGESSIRPAVMVNQGGKDDTSNQYQDKLGYFGALTANIVAGQMGVDATGVYIYGKNKVSGMKYSAYAADIAPYYKVTNDIKASVFVTFISGWDGSGSTDNSFADATISGKKAGVNGLRLYIIEDMGTMGNNSNVTGAAVAKYDQVTSGYNAYGAQLSAKFAPVTVMVQGAYVMANKVASGVKDDMGIEFDGNISYPLTKVTNLFVEGAFLKTGDYFGTTKQNAYYASLGATFSL